ncbi:precorrin-8X methylmutase [Maridesulfovibrio hydrothermalis]|uniref:Cobalt-precorrin-8X methylmutase n=1 Tax=Maridesulfovibrio hydrothermalis AM13 = DSM 14728 TaxID=1121451 RepID=L0R778_9BACT|nr:precorrin-8X methylmutase [Maridesulfovibrio hydrothermalis]CCO22067.1 Cobalt-precorrin-8X methylmutase [Maridesulfovibrio hydrothermalis AM13 = DSM 14728]
MSGKVELITVAKPGDIEKKSFEIIDSEVPKPRKFDGIEWQIARRMVHTTADFDLIDLVRFHPEAISSGLEALRAGCTIVTDTEMARCGIPVRRMNPLGCTVRCLMNDPEVIAAAKKNETTRAHAALELAANILKPAVHVIGNAPTALIRLVKLIEEGRMSTPALVVGMPVGFVNAAESKAMLMNCGNIPYISIEGRKGGSALAACVINALAEVVLAEKAVSGEIS